MTLKQEFVTSLRSAADAAANHVGPDARFVAHARRHLPEIPVPNGFIITAQAFGHFLDRTGIRSRLKTLVSQLGNEQGDRDSAASEIDRLIREADFPEDLKNAVLDVWGELAEPDCGEETALAFNAAPADVRPLAIRVIRSGEDLVNACRALYVEALTTEVIGSRQNNGPDLLDQGVPINVTKPRGLKTDHASAGEVFSVDVETGFPRAVLITARRSPVFPRTAGNGSPDSYRVFKPLLNKPRTVPVIEKRSGIRQSASFSGGDSPGIQEHPGLVLKDQEACCLAQWAVTMEEHFAHPVTLDWFRDDVAGELFILWIRGKAGEQQQEVGSLKTWSIRNRGELLLTGRGAGSGIAAGDACVLESIHQAGKFREGGVLVTTMTDQEWVPLMKKAVALITDKGGHTSHAAIVGRELGLPVVVGTDTATRTLSSGRQVTVCCSEGAQGFVYEGVADFESHSHAPEDIPETTTAVMLSLAEPEAALRWWRLPADGVGPARMEFIISASIGIHPMALARPDEVEGAGSRDSIEELTSPWQSKAQYFIDNLACGAATIAASQYPRPVIVRMSDLKTNEYADLIGGESFEPQESNPMLGWRGASRYYSEHYREGFALECGAILKARNEMGLDNIMIMIPFCRTPEEAQKVIAELARNGLKRGDKGLEIHMMAELPSAIILAEEFCEYFDGFSIGSNDLTQLILGVDRDAEHLSGLFDERHRAVRRAIEDLITTAHRHGRTVGCCGQAPGDYPEFARFLVEAGVDSIAVTPDRFLSIKQTLAEAESLH
ncbi:phosphoenolpyruvate synthase [Marinobacter sp.]|uniref:phosphoenolpyruvate synthase n=1 Tax=Marinobacter sp. TaxID=50741 RepID=UPI00384C9CAE